MQKLYYSISEVCKMVDEEQHILRYWEKEFPHLKPRKNRGGNRIYSERDIELIRLIKNLLRVEKLSLKGAKESILKTYSDEPESSLFSDSGLMNTLIKDVIDEVPLEIKSKKKACITFTFEESKELLGLLKRFTLALGNKI